MEEPSSARTMFDSIRNSADPIALLKSFVTEQRRETGWLDFKGGQLNGAGDEQIKAIWSKALSAFSNTDGGVVVWGIDGKKNADGVDCANKLVPLKNPAGFRTKLDQLLPDATNPPTTGVEFFEFNDSAQAGCGYVISFVPESRFKPLRAEFKGKQYYLRTGSHSSPMEPGTLRHYFYPHGEALLRIGIKATLDKRVFEQAKSLIRFGIVLRNVGTRSAREIFVVMTKCPGTFNHQDTNWKPVGGCDRVALEILRPLHPQGAVPLGVTDFTSIYGNGAEGTIKVIGQIPPVEFAFRVYAADSGALAGEIALTATDIETKSEHSVVLHEVQRSN